MSDTIIASIITGLASLIVGFVTGYNYCIKVNVSKIQKQKAGDDSIQIQVGEKNDK